MGTPDLDLEDDAVLVERARAGDDEAFGALVRRHRPVALAVARSIVGDHAEAEDLAQEAFVRSHRNLDMLADPGQFGGWLRRIVFGVSIDWLRAFRPQLYRIADQPGDGELPDIPSSAPGALDRMERDELDRRVLQAVHELPERYRVPLTLYHLDGLSHERVARALDVPVGTVRSLVTRARARLRILLESSTREGFVVDQTDDVFEERPTPRVLHILNGSSTEGTLRQSGVPGTLAEWADVLYEGPVPPLDVESLRWREIRARFMAGRVDAPYEDVLRKYTEWDAAIDRFAEYDEMVIWCEHDLFDQLLLIRHLAWFAQRSVGRTRLSLICIGEFPGFERFKGLGELSADQLASLHGTRQRVTLRQLEIGRRAWRAFTSDDPRAIERLPDEEDLSPLPFLAAALRRYLEEFPSVRNGLSRSAQTILSRLGSEPERLLDVFPRLHEGEAHYYITDVTFRALLLALAGGSMPLIELSPIPDGGRFWDRGAVITAAGRAALAGDLDWVQVNGIDLWLGGVHLTGTDAEWRWDGDAGRLQSR